MKRSVLQHIQRASLLFIAGTLAVNLLGFFKSLLIANYYGTSADLDAYFLSLAPYRLISGILIAAVQVTMIPRYLELIQKHGKERGMSIFLSFSLWLIIAILFIGLIIFSGSSMLAHFLGKGFHPAQTDLTAQLLKITAWLLLLNLLEGLGMTLFHAHRHFVLAAFLPMVNGLCSLVYIVAFRSQGIVSLMYALVAGMTLQMGFTLYAGRQLLPHRISLCSPFDPEIKKTIRVMLPLLLGGSFGHVNVLIDQMMASTLPSGSIAALQYAGKLYKTLTQMFILMVSKAMLPFLAQQIADNDIEAMKKTFFQTLARTLTILVPISVGIIIFAHPIVRILFQRGAFTEESTAATAGAWIAYTLGVPIQAVGNLTARVYNARQDNHTLMYVSALSIGLNILFNIIFMRYWGHIGIALSTSVVYLVTASIKLYILHKKIGLR